LLLKELILDNLYIAEKKLKSLSETFYQLIKYQKVPLYQMLKPEPEIVDVSQKHQELIAPLLDTLKKETKPESDYHLEPEKLLPDLAELPLVLLPEVEEPINQFSKQVTCSINTNVRERCGQLLEVLL